MYNYHSDPDSHYCQQNNEKTKALRILYNVLTVIHIVNDRARILLPSQIQKPKL